MTWQAGKEEVSAFKLVPLFTVIPTCVISKRISGSMTTVLPAAFAFNGCKDKLSSRLLLKGGGGAPLWHKPKIAFRFTISSYPVVLVDVIWSLMWTVHNLYVYYPQSVFREMIDTTVWYHCLELCDIKQHINLNMNINTWVLQFQSNGHVQDITHWHIPGRRINKYFQQ